MFSKVIECLEQNFQNEIDCKRPSGMQPIYRVQNIRIQILAVCASTKFCASSITQARCN